RIFRREVAWQGRAINRQGAIMILKKICYETELSSYGSSSKRAGFAEKLYDAINKLRSCLVTPDDLREASSDRKILDVANLYEKFLQATAGKFVDAGGRVALLSQAVDDGALRNCKFYIALYDVITPELQKLIEKIDQKCGGVTLFTTDENISYRLGIKPTVTGCDSTVVQYKEIAKSIKRYMYENARKGAKFSDIAVIDESGSYAVMKRIFDEYSIPYYADVKIALSDSELYRLIVSAFNAHKKGYNQEDMLELAHNYYLCADLDREYIVAFTDYVKRRCVNYKGFWEEFDDKYAELVRLVVVKAVEIMDVKADTVTVLSDKIKKLLEFVNAEEKTKRLNDNERLITGLDRNLGQIYEKTVEIINLYAELFARGDGDEEKLFDTLREGLDSCDVSIIPNRTDMVMVANLSAFRGQRLKRAYIVNFNDGVLPKSVTESGLILDADADKLNQYNLNITPKIEQKNKTIRIELWKILSVCSHLEIYYNDADGRKPSYDLKQLCEHNGVEPININTILSLRRSLTDPMEIAYGLGNRADAVETVRTVEQIPYVSAIEEALGEEEYSFTLDDEAVDIDARKLFFPTGRTSVSAIQTYFDCPYKFFLRYGLKIKELEDGEVNVLDIGLLLHKFVEIYINEKMPVDTDEFVERNTPVVLALFEKYTYGQNERMLDRLKDEAKKLCAITKRHVDSGYFTPYGAEIPFGENPDDEFKTITLNGVSLMGEIDRLDTYGDYARVIDYKTGITTFSLADLYYGKKIQLTIYMAIMMENGYRPAGFFYFPFSISWKGDENSNRLDGPANASGDNLLWHDKDWDSRCVEAKEREIANGKKPPIYEKSKVLSMSAFDKKDVGFTANSKNAVEEEDLIDMCSYATEVTQKAIGEILDGYITPSPLSTGNKTTCDYCPYVDICGKSVVQRRTSKVEIDRIKGALN
ncbi:MAG: PD-(D/E)XK nuclease family protein, partial [Clostridia bacterium]|nr:PD-(D/E)XK nuclease family protein [Clostridia bacterium]